MLLSIIIGYNHEPPERVRMLKSLNEQDNDFSEVEIIVSESYVKPDGGAGWDFDLNDFPHIKDHVVLLSKDSFIRGPGQSRQNALDIAKGTYVVFWDFDDKLCDTHCITTLLKVITEDIAQGGTTERFEFDILYEDNDGSVRRESYNEYFSPMTLPALVMKTSFLRTHNLRFLDYCKSYEDAFFSWQQVLELYNQNIHLTGTKTVHTPLYYHINSEQVSSGEFYALERNLNTISDIYNYCMVLYEKYNHIFEKETLFAFYHTYVDFISRRVDKIKESSSYNKIKIEVSQFIRVIDNNREFYDFYNHFNFYDFAIIIDYTGNEKQLDLILSSIYRQRDVDLSRVEIEILCGPYSPPKLKEFLYPGLMNNVFIIPDKQSKSPDILKYIMSKNFTFRLDSTPLDYATQLYEVLNALETNNFDNLYRTGLIINYKL